MRQLLKQALTQHIQVLGRNFRSLDLSVLPWNDVQINSLETLRASIQRLKQIINQVAPSDAPTNPTIRQEMYAQLTIIIGFSQILLYKEAGELGAISAISLQNMLKVSDQIQDALEADKANTTSNPDLQIAQPGWATAPRPSR